MCVAILNGYYSGGGDNGIYVEEGNRGCIDIRLVWEPTTGEGTTTPKKIV